VLLECHGLPNNGVLREIVSVRYPTDAVCKLLVVARKVGGAPAVDRVSDILGGGHNGGEDDEDDDGVAMVESVD